MPRSKRAKPNGMLNVPYQLDMHYWQKTVVHLLAPGGVATVDGVEYNLYFSKKGLMVTCDKLKGYVTVDISPVLIDAIKLLDRS